MTSSLWSRLAEARVYDLEQPRVFGMPIFPSHKPGYFYALHRRHRDSYQPAVHGPRSGASGMLTMMEHTGTHIDALCHQACELTLFGGTPAEQVETPAGFTELGAETIPPLVGRGVLLDVPGSMGLTIMAPGYEISGEELAECAAKQGVEIRPGDVLLVRTGYGAIWNDEARYLAAAGIAKSGSLWAAAAGVRAVGADNMAWDVPGVKDPETGATLFGHVYLLPQKGIYILENLNLEALAHDRHYEFGFVGVSLKFVGATGSPLRPLALVDPPGA